MGLANYFVAMPKFKIIPKFCLVVKLIPLLFLLQMADLLKHCCILQFLGIKERIVNTSCGRPFTPVT